MERNDSLRVFTKDSGFVFTGGKLQEVKYLRTDFWYDHKEGDFSYYHAKTTCQLPNGTTDTLEERYGGYELAYDSVEDYEKGVSAKTSYKQLFVNNEMKRGDDVIRDIFWHRKSNCVSPVYWYFDKCCHVAVKETLDLNKFYFDYSDNKFHTKNLPDGDIYDTKEEALSYNTYKVVEHDGTEYERDGVNKLLEWDDDQKKLIAKFEDIIRELKKHDILLLADCSEQMTAYNLRKVQNYAISYNGTPDVMEGEPEEYERAYRYGEAFRIDHCVQWYGDDNDLYILRKKVNDTNNKNK